ncbi:cold shock domain-containing protein [Desulfomicrobium baculatum]|uniref:Cold-shock DNA-binding domain protein n=1 Tax=Desulfomicrobium baculatum (strain DSM 4028 / VKM B-1378 / X) TaxID=525897 RepID=C7LWH7_DESBD|nr:cold shock domain-containing protein [Desulfomicrobium baculatum]ACU88669.1 cold-shock DNA-binding domain protein [Desulfomicrobium baculatum DSM 4028]
MRFHGEISEWRDDRGFGFITPTGGGTRVFVHISALQKGRRPRAGEMVTYEVGNSGDKGPRALNVNFVNALPGRRNESPRRSFFPVVVLVLLIAAGAYGARRFVPSDIFQAINIKQQSPRAQAFACEGKIYCSEMNSCEEALFYLDSCPGVQIDGDGDGVPCEKQWCNE